MLSPQEVIRKKRDKIELTEADIRSFVLGIGECRVSDAQIGAFTMAVFLNGMTEGERVALTLAMRDSGTVMDWTDSGIDAHRIVEKHSSGGVGDEKNTLIVVPLAAACGLYVPNLSAWGLDYCGGECDLLDAVPGYDGSPSPQKFKEAVRASGGAIIGPTGDLAPADRKIFKIRDVTASVESIALITASIMSKKLAAAPSALVVTVGSGSGAYMATVDDARRLGESMAGVASGAGIPSVMLLTDLDAVLGTSVGAAVEVLETIDFLTGAIRDPRVEDLVLTVTAEMIVLAGLAPDLAAGREVAAARLADGSATDRFDAMIAALGGPADFVANARTILPTANLVKPVFPEREGYVTGMTAKEIGLALITLGGGRKTPDEAIDWSVGCSDFCQVGDRVGPHNPLCVVHARNDDEYEAAARRIRSAVRVGTEAPPPLGPIVIDRISRDASD